VDEERQPDGELTLGFRPRLGVQHLAAAQAGRRAGGLLQVDGHVLDRRAGRSRRQQQCRQCADHEARGAPPGGAPVRPSGSCRFVV
jgi:hypothetical protein